MIKNLFKGNIIKSQAGLTLIELMIVIGIIGILSAIAIPQFYSGQHKLKKAATELFSDIKKTKASAIRTGKSWAIVFNPGVVGNPDDDSYFITSGRGADGAWSTIDADGSQPVEKTIRLKEYYKGVCYGHGSAIKNATYSSGTLPTDGISYPTNVLSFDSKGICSDAMSGYGYRFVYLKYWVPLKEISGGATENPSYAVGTNNTGATQILYWNENKGEWQ